MDELSMRAFIVFGRNLKRATLNTGYTKGYGTMLHAAVVVITEKGPGLKLSTDPQDIRTAL